MHAFDVKPEDSSQNNLDHSFQDNIYFNQFPNIISP